MMRTLAIACRWSFLIAAFACLPLAAAEPIKPTHADVVYAEVDGNQLHLDLYLPKDDPKKTERLPLVVFIHGGSWRAGSYKSCPVAHLAEAGFAVASIQY